MVSLARRRRPRVNPPHRHGLHLRASLARLPSQRCLGTTFWKSLVRVTHGLMDLETTGPPAPILWLPDINHIGYIQFSNSRIIVCNKLHQNLQSVKTDALFTPTRWQKYDTEDCRMYNILPCEANKITPATEKDVEGERLLRNGATRKSVWGLAYLRHEIIRQLTV